MAIGAAAWRSTAAAPGVADLHRAAQELAPHAATHGGTALERVGPEQAGRLPEGTRPPGHMVGSGPHRHLLSCPMRRLIGRRSADPVSRVPSGRCLAHRARPAPTASDRRWRHHDAPASG